MTDKICRQGFRTSRGGRAAGILQLCAAPFTPSHVPIGVQFSSRSLMSRRHRTRAGANETSKFLIHAALGRPRSCSLTSNPACHAGSRGGQSCAPKWGPEALLSSPQVRGRPGKPPAAYCDARRTAESRRSGDCAPQIAQGTNIQYRPPSRSAGFKKNFLSCAAAPVLMS
jgi:hypothetical protein